MYLPLTTLHRKDNDNRDTDCHDTEQTRDMRGIMEKNQDDSVSTNEMTESYGADDHEIDENYIDHGHEGIAITNSDVNMNASACGVSTPRSKSRVRIVCGKRRKPSSNDTCRSTSDNHRRGRKKSKRQNIVTPYQRPRRTNTQEVGEPLRRYRHHDGTWEITHSVRRVRVGLKLLFFGGEAIVRSCSSSYHF